MKRLGAIKLSKGQILTVSTILLVLTSISYQLYLLRKSKKTNSYEEALFVFPED
jgi:cbb3-type cytochrome oxidase subunit 3